jgi:hypothetical protein
VFIIISSIIIENIYRLPRLCKKENINIYLYSDCGGGGGLFYCFNNKLEKI